MADKLVCKTEEEVKKALRDKREFTLSTTLTELNLQWNNIGSSGAKSLSDSLKGNTTLTELSLSYNNIGDEGAKALLEAMKMNYSINQNNNKDNVSYFIGNNQCSAGLQKALEDEIIINQDAKKSLEKKQTILQPQLHQESIKQSGTTEIQLDAPCFKMNVPSNATKTPHSFFIKNPPVEKVAALSSFVDGIKSSVLELGPHDVNFEVPVSLEFTVPKGAEYPPAVFIQDALGAKVDGILRVPANIRENGNDIILSLKVKRFSLAFVASDFGTKIGVISNIQNPDTISDGLNCRGVCTNSNCNRKGKFVTCNIGYTDWDPTDPFQKSFIKCPLCLQCFDARQIIFCNARFTIHFQKKLQGPQTINDEVNGGTLRIFGDHLVSKAAVYEKVRFTCQIPIYTPGVANSLVDKDAANDGAFTGKKILVANFAGQENTPALFDAGPGVGLKKKGFSYHIVTTELEFANLLPGYDIGWIVSYNQAVNNTVAFLQACVKHHEQGKGLFLMGDNDPCNQHVNVVLSAMFGFRLSGNTPADKELTLSAILTTGTFLPSHIITTGIPNLYEGVTISMPTSVPANFNILAKSTDGNPCILYADANVAGIRRGRVVVDTGWTKLCYKWNTVGTARYVNNAACWLAGFDTSSCYYTL